MAGLVVGSEGPVDLAGTAPGASLLPIRIAGWQPDASGGVSIYGRTDQLLAGLELAVDPNEDGDAHDAVRVALVGVVEPFAAFVDGLWQWPRQVPRSRHRSLLPPGTMVRLGRRTAASEGRVAHQRL